MHKYGHIHVHTYTRTYIYTYIHTFLHTCIRGKNRKIASDFCDIKMRSEVSRMKNTAITDLENMTCKVVMYLSRASH